MKKHSKDEENSVLPKSMSRAPLSLTLIFSVDVVRKNLLTKKISEIGHFSEVSVGGETT